MSVAMSLAIIGSVAFGGAILWMAWEAISAPIEDRWANHRDRQYRDRVNTVPESYPEAIKMIAANSDKPIAQFTKWPEITEDKLKSIYHGEG
jgi:hypothetical protein